MGWQKTEFKTLTWAVVLKLKSLIQILENWTPRLLDAILLAILTDRRDIGFILQIIMLKSWKHDMLCSLRMLESVGAEFL
jgi:hypothetical protein